VCLSCLFCQNSFVTDKSLCSKLASPEGLGLAQKTGSTFDVHTLNMVFIYLWMDRRTAPLSSSLPFLAAFPFAMIPTERPVAIAYLYSLLRAVPLARLCLVSINHESIKCF
jgi:hypothetical protein